MNPQDILNQNIRLLIGDLQVNLMMANARVAELEAQVGALTQALQRNAEEIPEAPANGNGKWKEALPI